MCLDPASATALTLMKVSAAMSAATAVASYAQGNAVADAQEQAIKQNAALQQADLDRQAGEQREADASQMNEQARAAMKDMALFDVVAGEFGGGVSSDRASASMGIQQGEATATLAKNSDNVARQGSMTSLALQARTGSQLASISRPSLIGTALSIGGTYAGYMGDAKKLGPNGPALTPKPTP